MFKMNGPTEIDHEDAVCSKGLRGDKKISDGEIPVENTGVVHSSDEPGQFRQQGRHVIFRNVGGFEPLPQRDGIRDFLRNKATGRCQWAPSAVPGDQRARRGHAGIPKGHGNSKRPQGLGAGQRSGNPVKRGTPPESFEDYRESCRAIG